MLSGWGSAATSGVRGMADLSWGSNDRPDVALAAAELGDHRRSRSRSGGRAGGSSKADEVDVRKTYGAC